MPVLCVMLERLYGAGDYICPSNNLIVYALLYLLLFNGGGSEEAV